MAPTWAESHGPFPGPAYSGKVPSPASRHCTTENPRPSVHYHLVRMLYLSAPSMASAEFLSNSPMSGKTAFVTGGGSGINLGIASAFARAGANVGICGRNPDRLEEAAGVLSALGAQVSAHVADVRNYEVLQAALEAARQQLGPVHTLVCGAAGNFLASADQLTSGGFKAVVDIDLLGSFHACRAALDQLRETRGVVLFVSAGQGLIPYAGQVHCGAAKAGVENLMRNLALEWGRHGIRANSIVPGITQGTEGFRRLMPKTEDAQEGLRRSIPLGRFGSADEIGKAAVFLSSPLASYITGTTLMVDGGLNLLGSAFMAAHMRPDAAG